MLEDLLYKIALTLVDGVGDINAKSLLAYCGSPAEVFRQKKGQLQRVPGIGEKISRAIAGSRNALKRAEQELKFVDKYKVRCLFFTDDMYPAKLKTCDDGPVMLYYKGSTSLSSGKMVAIVGTRRPSEFGRVITEELVRDLSAKGVTVVSGLAYGIDAFAHRAALGNNIPTVGVLGHGLDIIYPAAHDKMARKMLQNGGLLTEFMSCTKPDAVNFPRRNRIVAGMCDALVVVESKRTGGSLITATIASSYNRDVFAVPGRAGDVLAEGCNGLIKQNKAALIENAGDLLQAMNWESDPASGKQRSQQVQLPLTLGGDEKQILGLFGSRELLHIDEIAQAMQMTAGKVSGLLLQLEFANFISSRPGKMYVRNA